MITISSSNYESLKLYVEHRIRPGSFLQAVLENDLKQSFQRADSNNTRNMRNIVQFCYSSLPGNCWGSPNAVKNWLNHDPDTSPDVPAELQRYTDIFIEDEDDD